MTCKTYWYHAESGCVLVAETEEDARNNANAGCDEITLQQYLTYKTSGHLNAQGT